MLSNILSRISFWSLFLVAVLLPVFVLPFANVPIETSKGFLLVIGLSVSVISWLASRIVDGRVVFPRSVFLLSGVVVIVAFLLSAIFSTTTKVSFFGTMLDVGTFWFVFSAMLLMFASAVIFKDIRKAKMVLFGVMASFAVVLVFQILRFFFPETLSLDVLRVKTDNILGSWNSLGIFAGFAVVTSLYVLEFFSTSSNLKKVLWVLMALSLVLIGAINFSLIWALLGVFALLIFIYKVSFFSGVQGGAEGNKHFPALSLVVVMISLMFLVSSQFIGAFLPQRLGLVSTEITPSFGATMQVAKGVIAKDPVLGIGLNKFGEAWAMYKPASINSTQFSNIYFESGFGFFPTLFSVTGVVGILALVVFFALFLRVGIKSIFFKSEREANLEPTIFFLLALYLFSSAFFYSAGAVILLSAFVFAGIFVGLTSSRLGQEVSINFTNNPQKSFFSIAVLVVMMVLVATLSFKYIERFASVSHFTRALASGDIQVSESAIKKAIALHPNDLYFRTYAQVYLFKFNSLVGRATQLSDAEKAELQSYFDQAVSGAILATNYNRGNYLNFQTLGYVYSTVGSYGVEGANDKAVEAYNIASNLNPLNPELKVLTARALFNDKKFSEANDKANEAVTLKPDYIDAHIVLSQIAKAMNDNARAISHAETALSIDPASEDLINYLNSLKNPGSNVSP